MLLLLAVVIGTGAFFYTNWLVKNMAKEERKSVELWAEATQKLASADINSNQDITFLTDIINRNTTIPVIVADNKEQILITKNINFTEKTKTQTKLIILPLDLMPTSENERKRAKMSQNEQIT